MGVIRLNDHLSDRHVDVRIAFNEMLELLNDVEERFIVDLDLLGQIPEPLVETLWLEPSMGI